MQFYLEFGCLGKREISFVDRALVEKDSQWLGPDLTAQVLQKVGECLSR